MKTAEKTKTKATKTQPAQSFFNKEAGSKANFFPPQKTENTSFFSPTIQAKLEVGSSGDVYEQEADRVADQVMRMPDPGIQRKCNSCEEEEKKIQRKPLIQRKVNGNGKQTASPEISSGIAASRGSGKSLDKGVSTEIGSKMGTDFSGVKVHTDNRAIQLSQDLGAKAFTVGNDIYFNKGQYNLASREGKRLMAHELVHTVQQGKTKLIHLQQKKTIPVNNLNNYQKVILRQAGWNSSTSDTISSTTLNQINLVIKISLDIKNDKKIQAYSKIQTLTESTSIMGDVFGTFHTVLPYGMNKVNFDSSALGEIGGKLMDDGLDVARDEVFKAYVKKAVEEGASKLVKKHANDVAELTTSKMAFGITAATTLTSMLHQTELREVSNSLAKRVSIRTSEDNTKIENWRKKVRGTIILIIAKKYKMKPEDFSIFFYKVGKKRFRMLNDRRSAVFKKLASKFGATSPRDVISQRN